MDLEKQLNTSIKDALELPIRQTTNLLVGISGAPVELLTRANKPYLIVNLADNSGETGVKIWDRVEEAKERFKSGDIWTVLVKKSIYDGNPQLELVPGNSLEVKLDELDNDDRLKILEKVARVYNADASDVKKIISTISTSIRYDVQSVFDFVFGVNPDKSYGDVLRAIDEATDHSVEGALTVLDDMEFFKDKASFEKFHDFCHCPAAKGHHGAYIHGLLCHVGAELDIITSLRDIYEHSRSLSTKSETERLYEFVDFDSISLTCIVHDFFKTEEYIWDAIGTIDFANEKGDMLFYHDMQIAFKLQAMPCEDQEEIKELVDKVTHGVMRHHGQWADYQPSNMLKTFVESDIFHFVDVLDARIVGAIEG